MFLLFLCLISISQHKKCKCGEIYSEDLCRDTEGCSFNIDTQLCEEEQCLTRSSNNCTHFAGTYRCYWDLDLGYCQDLTNCDDINNKATDITIDICNELGCYWDYQYNNCTSEQDKKNCIDYTNSTICQDAYEINEDDESIKCVIKNYVTNNTNELVNCIAFEKCEDIKIKTSCDDYYCLYEDENCKTKKCQDFLIDECPSYDRISNQQCYPNNDQCVEFQCSDFTMDIFCNNHPRCFWSEDLNTCSSQICNKATYATQCFSFSYIVENTECKWENDQCKSCISLLIHIIMIYYILLISF